MIATPPSMAFEPRQTSVVTSVRGKAARIGRGLELWLEEERERLPLWVPVALAIGIADWFVLPNRLAWLAFCCAMLAAACGALILTPGGRMRRGITAGGLLAYAGCLLVWGNWVKMGSPAMRRSAVRDGGWDAGGIMVRCNHVKQT